MKISLIAALSSNFVIGKNNDLPWRLPNDMKFFMNTTKGHHVLMGRKNYDSIPEKFRPLKDRVNLVMTRQDNLLLKGCEVINALEEGINFAKRHNETELFIIGGAEIYEIALPYADRLYLTEIHATIEGDKYFPKFEGFKEISRVTNAIDDKHAYAYDFVIYEK